MLQQEAGRYCRHSRGAPSFAGATCMRSASGSRGTTHTLVLHVSKQHGSTPQMHLVTALHVLLNANKHTQERSCCVWPTAHQQKANEAPPGSSDSCSCSTPAGEDPAGRPRAAPGPLFRVTLTTTGLRRSSTVRHSPSPKAWTARCALEWLASCWKAGSWQAQTLNMEWQRGVQLGAAVGRKSICG